MAPVKEESQLPVLTAALTSGIACVTHGLQESRKLIDKILRLDHRDWESILSVGDVEFHQTKDGPFPNHKMIVSVSPSKGYAALNFVDNDDPNGMSVVNSYNPRRPLPDVYLVFNGTTGAVFPRTAALPIPDTRKALHEWLHTRRRPTCIEWRPFGIH
jgi:Immunity protein Imm1